MSKVRIYTTTYCPYCIRAKSLLDKLGVQFEEVNLTANPEEKRRVMEEFGWKTVPIILINDRLVGGFNELRAVVREKKLDKILAHNHPT